MLVKPSTSYRILDLNSEFEFQNKFVYTRQTPCDLDLVSRFAYFYS